jgi:excisionase family DNA binding protein
MVAQQFNVSPCTVLRLIERRELRAVRIGRQWRFREEWVDEMLVRKTTDPKKGSE